MSQNAYTRFCQSMIDTGTCERKNCSYAHSPLELRIKDCGYGEFCSYQNNPKFNGSVCLFLHPDETKETYFTRTGMKVPVATPKKEEKDSTLVFTRFCQSMVDEGVCSKYKCLFAHTADELVIKECGYGDACVYLSKQKPNGTLCSFFHPNETRDSYFKRTGMKLPPPKQEEETSQNVFERSMPITEVEQIRNIEKQTDAVLNDHAMVVKMRELKVE